MQIFRGEGRLINFAGMSNEIRKVIAAATPGFLLGVVFCILTLCTRSFLERTCRIESGQSKAILLIALILAAPIFVIFTRWSDRIARKWIIPGGLLLAFLAWFLLFRQVPVIAGTAGRIELTDQKEIQSTVAFIGKSRDLTRTTSTFTRFADGMQLVETKEDTVFANGRISANPRTTLSGTLNSGDFWKIVPILFLMALSVAMICGPIVALLTGLLLTRIRYTALSRPFRIGNGIAAGLVPFVAVLLTGNRPGETLAGLWYPLGILAVCFVTGALAIPPKDRKFAHVN